MGTFPRIKDKCSKHMKAYNYRFSPLLFCIFFTSRKPDIHPYPPFLLLIPSSALSSSYPPSTNRKQRVLRHCKEDSSHSSSISNTKSCNGKKQKEREGQRDKEREREATAFRSPGALLSRSHSALHYLVTADASLGQTGTKSSPKSIVSTAEWLSIAGCIHLLRHLKKKKKKKKACAIVTKGERGG